METKYDLTTFTNGSDFFGGILIYFGLAECYFWGPYKGTNLKLEKSGANDIANKSCQSSSGFLRVRKTGSTYYFDYKTNEQDKWTNVASHTTSTAPQSVGFTTKTWSQTSVVMDFDYLKITGTSATGTNTFNKNAMILKSETSPGFVKADTSPSDFQQGQFSGTAVTVDGDLELARESVNNVIWTKASSNVSITGNSIGRTSGTGFDAGAISMQKIKSGDGYLEFKINNSSAGACGLSADDPNYGKSSLDYAFNFSSSDSIWIEENNVTKWSGYYSPSQLFKIAVINGKVTYFQNGSPIYRSTVEPTYTLFADCSIYDTYFKIVEAKMAPTLYRTLGSYISTVYDISSTQKAPYSKITWNETIPSNTSVSVQTNVSLDRGITWFGWKSAVKGGAISDITDQTDLSKARVQYKVNLFTADVDVSPELHDITLNVGGENRNIGLAKFNRDSSGYNSSGVQVSSGVPRYENGYWHNLLTDNQADVEVDTNGFYLYGGIALNRTTTDP